MGRILRVAGATFLAATLMLGASAARASELQDEYEAYQEAAAAGDLRAALPHAQRAYELGLEQFGPDSRNTGLLAFNFGYALNETRNYDRAVEVLRVGSAALESANAGVGEEEFNVLLELGRAQLGVYDAPSARATLLNAQRVAETQFGEYSRENEHVYYYLAYVPLFFDDGSDNQAFHIASIQFESGSLYEADHGSIPYSLRVQSNSFPDYLLEENALHEEGQQFLDIAMRISQTLEQGDLEIAQADLVRAAYALDLGQIDEVDGLYAHALNELTQTRFADDFLMRLAIQWIDSRYQSGWNTEEIAENVTLVNQLAHLRIDGELVGLVRVPPIYPIEAISRGIEGSACVQFDVPASGRPQNIVVYETDSSYFEQASRNAISRFIYAPRMRNAEAVGVEGVRFCFIYRIDTRH